MNDLHLPNTLYKTCKYSSQEQKWQKQSIVSNNDCSILTLLPKYYISSLINHNVIRIVTKYYFILQYSMFQYTLIFQLQTVLNPLSYHTSQKQVLNNLDSSCHSNTAINKIYPFCADFSMPPNPLTPWVKIPKTILFYCFVLMVK